MAIIGKIQRQSTVLMIAIGGSMLLFVLGDLFTGNTNLFNSQPTEVGSIRGKDIPFKEFETTVEERLERYKESSRQLTLDQNTIDQIRNQVWNEYLQDLILLSDASDAGIVVSKEELFDMVQGQNPHQSIVQNFTNPETGQFNRADVLRYLQNLDKDPTGKDKYQWAMFERSIKKERQSAKYYNLIKKGLFASDAEGKFDFDSRAKTVNIQFVQKAFESISDSSIKYQDSDLKAFYSAHKSEPRYQQKETTRSLDYVTFDVIPSPDDQEFTRQGLETLKEEFAVTANDTLFVGTNANTRDNIKYYTAGSFSPDVDSLIMNSDSNRVVGPFFDAAANSYKLAKKVGEKSVPDSVMASHILIKLINGDTAKAMAKADSLKNLVIKNKADFAELAKTNSEDLGSAQQGGDLNWFTEGKMVPEFNDACFEGKVGDMPIVTSQFGVHLIKITNQTKPIRKALVAIVDHTLEAGKVTYEKAYNEASAFAINNTTAEKFKAASAQLAVKVADNIKEGDRFIAGLDSPRELVRWAYQAEIGDVSAVMEFGDKFVIATLRDIREKGTLTFESAKDLVTAEYLKEKKSEQLKAQVAGAKTIQEAAAKLGAEVQTAESISFASYSIPGIGGERALTGYALGLKPNVLSEPITGQRGIYLMLVTAANEGPATADYTSNKQNLERNFQGRVDYEVFQALQDNASVEDNRPAFY